MSNGISKLSADSPRRLPVVPDSLSFEARAPIKECGMSNAMAPARCRLIVLGGSPWCRTV